MGLYSLLPAKTEATNLPGQTCDLVVQVLVMRDLRLQTVVLPGLHLLDLFPPNLLPTPATHA